MAVPESVGNLTEAGQEEDECDQEANNVTGSGRDSRA